MVRVDYEGHIRTTVTAEVDVALTPNDIYNWLQQCEDAEILGYIQRTATGRRDRVLHPEKYEDTDDFRSRA